MWPSTLELLTPRSIFTSATVGSTIGVDLTGAHGIQRLRGSAMEWSDIVEMAGVWAAALGIEVLDG